MERSIDGNGNAQGVLLVGREHVLVCLGNMTDGSFRFYKRLAEEITEDIAEDMRSSWPSRGVTSIISRALETGVVSQLALWEYTFLDEDSSTSIQRKLNEGVGIFVNSSFIDGRTHGSY